MEKSSYPRYSALMSVYTKDKTEYLEFSIQSMLDQTVPPSEFVLVKDGPISAELSHVIQKFEDSNPSLFHVVALPQNVGLGPALAIGVKECHNELVARMDSDDYSVPERCQKELDCFLKDPHLDAVGCNVNEFIDDVGTVTAHRVVPECHKEIYKFAKRRCPLIHPTIIFKKSAVLQCGNYQNIRLCEDYDLLVRMLKHGSKFYNVQQYLFYVRVDKEVYKRRGGVCYAQTMVSFKRGMYRTGFSSFQDFFISAGGHLLVCLMPNVLRGLFYKAFLRKRAQV